MKTTYYLGIVLVIAAAGWIGCAQDAPGDADDADPFVWEPVQGHMGGMMGDTSDSHGGGGSGVVRDSGSSDSATAVDTRGDTGQPDSESSVVRPEDIPGVGGLGEPCLQRSDGFVCEGDLVALECSDNAVGCCCASSCTPALCTDKKGEQAPCIDLEMGDGTGFCLFSEDDAPVEYPCADYCTPRSSCWEFDDAGQCVYTEFTGPDQGLCLIFNGDLGDVFCRPSCRMNQCADGTRCVPVADSQGVFSGVGACIP